MRLRSLWDVLTVPGNPRVAAISGCFYTPGAALWYPLFPIYLLLRGVTSVEVGLVYAAGLGAGLLGTFVGGRLADKWGRKRMVILSGVLGASATFALALPVSPYFLFAAGTWSLVSFGFGFGTGASSALLYESSKDRKGASMAAPYFLPSIVAIPMPFIGVLFSERFGIFWLFIFAAALSFISVIIRGVWLTETHHPAAGANGGTSEKKTQGRGWRKLLSGPVGGIALLYAILAFSGWAFAPFAPLYFVRVLGSNVSFFGILASIEMVIAGALGFASGQLVDRFGPLKTAGYSMAGEAFCVSGLILARNILVAGVFYESWYAVDFLDQVAPGVFIGGETTPGNRASVMATYRFITQIPSVFAAGIGGILFTWNPYSLLMMEVALSAAAALAVFAYMSRPSSSPRAAVPPG
ncbi:MAG: MFS transporter [Nitrososphaerota archaeon]|nr:MFS transporter [Nitrososphaerota archaeon]